MGGYMANPIAFPFIRKDSLTCLEGILRQCPSATIGRY